MNMEMQVTYFEYWTNRVLYYLSKIYTGQVKTGDPYDTLKSCIHVSILDFIYFPEDAKCCRKIAFFDTENGKQYTYLMESYILELKKLPPEDQNEKGVIRWMRFLGGKSREEYELRQKAVRDYNTQIKSAEKRGEKSGEKSLIKLTVRLVPFAKSHC